MNIMNDIDDNHTATAPYGSATVTLPNDTDILIERSFSAPRVLVWEAITNPRLILRWWGPSWSPLVSAEVDLSVGIGLQVQPPCRLTFAPAVHGHGDEVRAVLEVTHHDAAFHAAPPPDAPPPGRTERGANDRGQALVRAHRAGEDQVGEGERNPDRHGVARRPIPDAADRSCPHRSCPHRS